MAKFQETLGINDLKAKNLLWRALLAEFIGNVLLNFFGCISCVIPSPVMIALTFGFVVFIVVQVSTKILNANMFRIELE